MRLGTKVESNKLTAKCVMMNDIVSRTRNLKLFWPAELGARLIIENSEILAWSGWKTIKKSYAFANVSSSRVCMA